MITHQTNGEHPFGNIGQLLSLGIFMVVWALDSFVLDEAAVLAEHISLPIRLIVSGIILVIAIYLIKSGHTAVEHGRVPSAVITTGAFKYVRHPMYLGSVLFYLSLAASTVSILSFALLIVIFLFNNHISSHEERILEQALGGEYRTYKRETGKWVPRVSGVRRNSVENHAAIGSK